MAKTLVVPPGHQFGSGSQAGTCCRKCTPAIAKYDTHRLLANGRRAGSGFEGEATYLVEAVGHDGCGHAEECEARGAGAGQAPRKADGGEPASGGAVLQDRQVLHRLQRQGASCWAGCQVGRSLHIATNSLPVDSTAAAV